MCIYYRAFLSNFVHFNFMWCNQLFYLPFFHVTCTFFFSSANCFKCGLFETREYIFLTFFAHQMCVTSNDRHKCPLCSMCVYNNRSN
jgi:hypothetical protein